MIRYWLYRSRALRGVRSSDDASIYLQARVRNACLAVTGYLHREGEHYLQYLEGPGRSLRLIEDAIRSDGRHCDVVTLDRGSAPERRFGAWDMAFTDGEMASFAAFRAAAGAPELVAACDGRDVLAFMDGMAELSAVKAQRAEASAERG